MHYDVADNTPANFCEDEMAVQQNSLKYFGGQNSGPVEVDDVHDLVVKKDGVTNTTYDPLAGSDTNLNLTELAFTRPKDLATTITAFRTGDVIPVDGPSGTAKMAKDDLLRETAENAITNGIAPAWNKNRVGGWKYNELCSYDGKLYVFNADHAQGDDWSGTDVTKITLSLLAVRGRNIIASVSPITSFNDLPINVVAQIGKNLDDSPDDSRHPWGVVKTICSPNGNRPVQEFIEVSNEPYYNNRMYRRVKNSGGWSNWTEIPNIEKLSSGHVFVGDDTTTKYDYIPAIEGSLLCMSVSDPAWADSNGPANKFAIRSVSSSGTRTDLKVYPKGSDVGKNIFVQVPSGAVGIELVFRANVGTDVVMQYRLLSGSDVDELVSQTITRYGNFELGTINYNASYLVYISSTSRMRTSKSFTISLSKYDCIVAKSGYEVYVIYSSDGEAPYSSSGWVDSYTAMSDEKVHIVFRRKVEADFTLAEASHAFFIFSSTSNVCVRNEIENSQDGVNYWRFDVVGTGQTAVITRFFPKVGQRLSFSCKQKTWDVTSITGAMFYIRYVKSDATTTDIIACKAYQNVPILPFDFIVPDDAVAIEFGVRAVTDTKLTFECHGESDFTYNKLNRGFIKGINHRGFCEIAPENTLPAFRLSKINGFEYVETDVRTTSDGELVCIHDDTVDRTSNGTGYVSSFTLAQLKALDFGSWKSAEFTGVTIPTFEEFIACIRLLGLKAYVEIKSASISSIMSIVDKYGMRKNITLTGSYSDLQSVIADYPDVRIGYVCSSADATIISNALSLKTLQNEVFLAMNINGSDATAVSLCKSNDIPLEVWGEYYGIDTMRGKDPYISGYYHNSVDACYVFATQEMNKFPQ